MAKKISLTVFFPCHNEEANVERVTAQALDVGRRVSDDLQVIIVDDGSRDRTAEIADRLAREHPEVEVVHHWPNRGYGGALQSGFRNARKEYVFYTDGDGQFDINEIDLLLPLIDTYDIVSAYRLNRQDSLIRKLNAAAWGFLMRLVLGLHVRDIDCAFKIYRREIFDRIVMKSQGALIDAEILARAQRRGYTIGQVGVHHYPRTAGEQSGANLKVILRAFKELLKLRKDIAGEPMESSGR
jgi:glycosyltransferase involved in cell wall biosynthesis